MSLSIVPMYDNIEWDRLINSSYLFDFNHTWHYHSAATSGEPLLLVYQETNGFIALPVLKQGAPGVITSHGGPVASKDFAVMEQGFQQRFESALTHYLEQHNVKSARIRLHPLIHQDFHPLYAGVLKSSNESLLIDLSLPAEEQQLHYGLDPGEALKRKGYMAGQAVAISEIDAFADIFRRNMSRLDTDTAGFYDKGWFRQMLRPAGFNTCLLIAWKDSQIAAGAMFTFCNNIMQLHLAATCENFLADAPLRILLNEAVMLGKKLGMRYLYLGGIPGSAEALFTCKAVSPEVYPAFRIWQLAGGSNVRKSLLMMV